MSGIVGIYYLDGTPISSRTLRHMTDRLAHRGPDDAGTWHDGSIGLGHRMLWTTPESLHEHLPLASSDGRRVITADARVDNREELITTLGITTPPEQLTDSQLILCAYERWGESCPEHLLGDFAFAIWDAERQHLFCARDHMGVKPFYYYRSDDLFAFASEIKALLCLDEVPREVDERAVGYALAGLWGDDYTVTSHKGVRRLLAAHSMTVTQVHARSRQYWCLDPTRESHFDSDEAYTLTFRELFTEAVRCRLRSAFPIGSELSGGLDSSSIVCVARVLLRQERTSARLHTFSAVFDEVPECDERPYISAVLAGGDLEPHYVHPDEDSLLTDAARRIWHTEEVEGLTPQSITYWKIGEVAKDVGVRVLLSGEWGDTVVDYGIGPIADLIEKGKWLTALREINRLSRVYGPEYGQWRRQLFRLHVVQPLTPRWCRKMWRKLRRSPTPTQETLQFIDAGFAERVGLVDLIDTRAKAADSRPRSTRRAHFDDLTELTTQSGLEKKDKAAAARALELRHPFLDRRLVEFCLALPPEQKVGEGYTRPIQRRAMAAFLPPEIQWRATKGEADPFIIHALLTCDRPSLEDVVITDASAIEPYVNLNALRQLYRRFSATRGSSLRLLWNIFRVALWLRETQADRSNDGL